MRRGKLAWLIPLGAGLAGCIIGSLVIGAEPTQDTGPRLSTAARVFVHRFIFDGNTVFSNEQLSRIVAPYVGREITSEELQEARRLVTLQYVNHGYINSGAVIPDQPVHDGVITIRVIEGTLSEINVTGNHWLRGHYLREWLGAWAGPPLNANRLREGLELLRQNPNVQQVNAELQPGALPGDSHLLVRVLDEQPYRVGLQVDNARPPSVGAEEISLMAGDRNLTGHSDALDLSYGIAHDGPDGFMFSKLDNVGGGYTLPITVRDTTLRIFGSKDDFAIIQEPFISLVTSESDRYGVNLRQPLYRTANRELAIGLTFERRESQTFVLGQPFTVEPGAVNGKTDITVVRLVQEWTDRSQNQVVAMRSTFSFGVDVFGTTVDGTNRNAAFWDWLGQFQYVRRLFDTPNQLILRTDVQWSTEPLLPLEQFTLGGASNVRGYRENQLLRDRGVYSGIELRAPVLANKAGAPIIQLAPFFDFGGGWNAGEGTPEPKTISSAGIGLLVSPNEHLHAQLYWGHAFRNLNASGTNLQDYGIHFQVGFEAF